MLHLVAYYSVSHVTCCVAACRYDKGAWGECTSGRMARTDALRPNSDPSCEQARQITKRCKPKGQKKAKGESAERFG